MRLPYLHDGRGVTLIEVTITLFIAAVVGITVLSGIFITISGNSSTRMALTAESLARSELEYVLSQPYDATNWNYTLPGAIPPGWGAHNIPDGYSGYTLTVSKTDLYDSSSIQQITVNVDYNSSPVLTISTYKTQ